MGFYASDLESRLVTLQTTQERKAIDLAQVSASKLELESAIQAYEDYNQSLMRQNEILTRSNTDLKMRVSEYDTILDRLQSKMRDASSVNGPEASGKGLLTDCLAEIHRREDFLSNAKANLTVARIQKYWVDKFRANKLAKQAIAAAAGPVVEKEVFDVEDSTSQQILDETNPMVVPNQAKQSSEETEDNASTLVEAHVEAAAINT